MDFQIYGIHRNDGSHIDIKPLIANVKRLVQTVTSSLALHQLLYFAFLGLTQFYSHFFLNCDAIFKYHI